MYSGMNVFAQPPSALNTYYVLCIVLDISDPKLEENNQNLCHHRIYNLVVKRNTHKRITVIYV